MGPTSVMVEVTAMMNEMMVAMMMGVDPAVMMDHNPPHHRRSPKVMVWLLVLLRVGWYGKFLLPFPLTLLVHLGEGRPKLPGPCLQR